MVCFLVSPNFLVLSRVVSRVVEVGCTQGGSTDTPPQADFWICFRVWHARPTLVISERRGRKVNSLLLNIILDSSASSIHSIMESDDFNAFEHLTPTGPPPLPGPDDLYPPDHPVPTHVFSPTPRRVLPRPGGEPLTTNFVINQHYLSLLASLDLREPRSAEPGVPFRTNLHAGSQSAGLEPIEEEQSQRSSPLRSLASSPPGPGDKVKSVSHLAVAMLGYTPHGAGADRGMSWLEGITSTEEGDSSILPQPTSLNPPPISEVFENHSMDLEPETQNLNAIVEPQGDPTGADQTICPVVPEMTAVDPACTFPTERPPAFELPPPSPEQTPPTTALLDVQPKPQAMRGSIRPPEQVSAEVAQWRTGKSPGYQGLTQKRRSSALSDEEDEVSCFETTTTANVSLTT